MKLARTLAAVFLAAANPQDDAGDPEQMLLATTPLRLLNAIDARIGMLQKVEPVLSPHAASH